MTDYGEISIESIVGAGDLGVELNLEGILNDINCYKSSYDPSKFAGLNLKFYPDAPTVSIYRSGSFTIRGASGFEDIQKSKEHLEREFSRLGINIDGSDFGITNIVFTGDLDTRLDLNKLSICFGLNSTEYEPEQFSGLVYRSDTGVALIFSSGKVVLTGVTKPEDAKEVYEEIISEIEDD